MLPHAGLVNENRRCHHAQPSVAWPVCCSAGFGVPLPPQRPFSVGPPAGLARRRLLALPQRPFGRPTHAADELLEQLATRRRVHPAPAPAATAPLHAVAHRRPPLPNDKFTCRR